jgi:hypothetical protein
MTHENSERICGSRDCWSNALILLAIVLISCIFLGAWIMTIDCFFSAGNIKSGALTLIEGLIIMRMLGRSIL